MKNSSVQKIQTSHFRFSNVFGKIFLIFALVIFAFSTVVFATPAESQSAEVSSKFNPYHLCTVKVMDRSLGKLVINTQLEVRKKGSYDDEFLRVLDSEDSGLSLSWIHERIPLEFWQYFNSQAVNSMRTIVILTKYKGTMKASKSSQSETKYRLDQAKRFKKSSVLVTIVNDAKAVTDNVSLGDEWGLPKENLGTQYRMAVACKVMVPEVINPSPRVKPKYLVKKEVKEKVVEELSDEGANILRASEGF